MEMRVECAEGTSLPAGCHIGVRIGDVLKQGRYEPQRTYHFQPVERKRNAKIDVYQHMGSALVAVDPELQSQCTTEVTVACSDGRVLNPKLKVSIQSGESPEKRKEQRQERSNQLKNKAKEYLSTHCIEERLAEAVKALLKSQPTDPTSFLTQHLMGSDPRGPQKPVVPVEAPKAAARELPQQAALQPQAPKTQALKPEAKAPPAVPVLSAPAPIAAPQPAAKKESAPPWKPAPSFNPRDAPAMLSNVSLMGGNILAMGMGPCMMFI